MTKQCLSEKILEKIKEKNITPKPKWTFLLKDYSIWLLSVGSLIIGSLAVSVIIFLVRNDDWDVYKHINDSLGQFILLTLPYFWIIFLIIFILAANYNIKHTKKGYKYELHTLVFSGVAISLLLGVFLHNFGVGHAIDKILTHKMPVYTKVIQGKHGRWADPEKGLLAGQIIKIENKDKFKLKDLKENTWVIVKTDNTFVKMVEIKIDERVRIIGAKQGDNVFQAIQIMSAGKRFDGERRMFRPPHHLLKLESERKIFDMRNTE